MSDSCPACFRGAIVEDKCLRCGIILVRGSETPINYRRATPRRRVDQDVVRGLTDYARTREDKK